MTSLVLGSSVSEIGSNAFYRCGALTSVVIPNSVSSISEYAFSGCGKLDTIIMGYGIKNIGVGAFNNCDGADVYITAQTPPKIQADTFGDYSGKLHLQGQEAINEYNKSNYWKNFKTELMIEPTALKIEQYNPVSGNSNGVFNLKASLEPENVTLPNILWYSINPRIATVNNSSFGFSLTA